MSLAFLVPDAAEAAARDLFVSSSLTNNVKRFDGVTGESLGNFFPNGSGGLSNTQECLFGPDGHMYVTGFNNGRILRYHGATGDFLGPWSSGFTLSLPTKTVYGPDGHMYVSQWGGDEKVVIFDEFTGNYLGDATTTGVVNGMGQDWDAQGNLYVASWGLNGTDGDVFVFDPSGVLIGSFVQPGFVLGPVNLWFDDDGDLLVQDWTQGTVERFDSNGNWLSTFVSGMQRTEGWVYGPDGMLYLCDWALHVVNRYFPDGTFDQLFATNPFLNTPNGVTFGLEHPVSAPEPAPLRTAWLGQSSPNPSAGRTVIRFGIRHPGSVRLTVHDVTGRLVQSVLEERTAGLGDRSVTLDAAGLPAGVYFYTLRTDQGSETRRMTVLR